MYGKSEVDNYYISVLPVQVPCNTSHESDVGIWVRTACQKEYCVTQYRWPFAIRFVSDNIHIYISACYVQHIRRSSLSVQSLDIQLD